jgi:hypothetical protein
VPNCGFTPKSDEEKALMLSIFYEINNEYRGMSEEQLIDAGHKVADKTYHFDDAEVLSGVAAAREGLALPPPSLALGS